MGDRLPSSSMRVLLISSNTERINLTTIPLKTTVGIRIYPGPPLARRAVQEGLGARTPVRA
jgi:hypothetical protein